MSDNVLHRGRRKRRFPRACYLGPAMIADLPALARKLKISRKAVYAWKVIPAERVVAVEKATGIPRQQLRPDLYEGMKPL